MADTIKIGDSSIAFKVGSGDCKIYLGNTLVYPNEEPQTLQWVTFTNGDTIPSDLNIYGIKGVLNDLSRVFYLYDENIYVEDAGRNKFNTKVGDWCYSENDIVSNTSIEYIFSNVGCADSYTVAAKTIANTSNPIQLYIYA